MLPFSSAGDSGRDGTADANLPIAVQSICFIELRTHHPGHFSAAVEELSSAAYKRGLRVVVVGVADNGLAGNLRSRNVTVVKSGVARGGLEALLSGSARCLQIAHLIGHRFAPESSIPFQLLHVSRALSEAWALRVAKRLVGRSTTVILTASESLAGFTARAGGAAHLRVVHDVTSHDGATIRAIERRCRGFLTRVAIIATTNSVARDVLARSPTASIVVQPFAAIDQRGHINGEIERRAGRARWSMSSSPYACLVGGWWRPKDISTVVRAIEMLDDPPGLVVAGAPLDDALVRRLEARLGPKLMVIARPISEAERRAVYSAADFTIVSREAGADKESGLVADAVRFGIPLVVSDHDLVQAASLHHESWAVVYSAQDPRALADALRCAMRGLPRPDRAAGMRLGFLTSDEIVARYERLYKDLVC